MPTYQYQCKKCGFELEELQSFAEPALLHCPQCNNDSLVRIIGSGGGLIFKGSGFYQTDYKKSGSPTDSKPAKKKKDEKKPESTPTPASAGKTPSGDSKPPSTKKE